MNLIIVVCPYIFSTVLELACIGKDWDIAMHVLPKVLNAKNIESFMPKTTHGHLVLLKNDLRKEVKDLNN